MSVNWIAANPKLNVVNTANQQSMSDAEFEELIRWIVHVIHFTQACLPLFRFNSNLHINIYSRIQITLKKNLKSSFYSKDSFQPNRYETY